MTTETEKVFAEATMIYRRIQDLLVDDDEAGAAVGLALAMAATSFCHHNGCTPAKFLKQITQLQPMMVDADDEGRAG